MLQESSQSQPCLQGDIVVCEGIMDFTERKSAVLASLSSSDYTDRSTKGSLDEPIIPLINAINRDPSYCTTSSCSGRISIFSHPSDASVSKKKARGGSWIFVTHDPADPDAVIDILFGCKYPPTTLQEDLVLRFEPLIVAVESKDLGSAQALVSNAISCGFRESGITNSHKRIMVTIRCSMRLEVPLGGMSNLMITRQYVQYLIRIANDKMSANRKRTGNFLQNLLFKERPFVLETKGIQEDSHTSYAALYSEEENSSDGLGKEEAKDLSASFDMAIHDNNLAKSNPGSSSGPSTISQEYLSSFELMISGEPVEKLFLWGHSACAISQEMHDKIVIFGGFGGQKYHSRRNDTYVLDPFSGRLVAVNTDISPSPRLGHTCSFIGEQIFVLGGRGDHMQSLGDMWALDVSKWKWKLLGCTGSVFHPRHRHAAAVVGSKIYTFGGLDANVTYSSMHVLDTRTSKWSTVSPHGKDWPCARHSHSLIAYGAKIFMFGGYDGEKVLGDLYSFDIKTGAWMKVDTGSVFPAARFSHSMFIYKYYLGIVGGCPLVHHFQEISLLNLQCWMWRHVKILSMCGNLLVRGSAIVIGDHLVTIGGGASCYAFGAKFNKPMKIYLQPLLTSREIPEAMKCPVIHCNEMMRSTENPFSGNVLVLRLEKRYCKFGKDILKKFHWLDFGRRIYSSSDGVYMYLPVMKSFCHLFHDKAIYSSNMAATEQLVLKGVSVDEISAQVGLCLLLACRGIILDDDVVCTRRPLRSPHWILKEAVSSLIKQEGLPQYLLDYLPTRWQRLGDMVVLPVSSFRDITWNSVAGKLWPAVASSLGASRLARQGTIVQNGTRDSTLEILVGDNGWVTHHENGIFYSFDATTCMFSAGNLSEKRRMAHLDCTNEIIVDLFAGIGYFVLPFLVKAKAKLVYACEWNPHAVTALRRNVEANYVADRCIILEGDNRVTAPMGVADRVCLGLLPTSEYSWDTAVKSLRL